MRAIPFRSSLSEAASGAGIGIFVWRRARRSAISGCRWPITTAVQSRRWARATAAWSCSDVQRSLVALLIVCAGGFVAAASPPAKADARLVDAVKNGNREIVRTLLQGQVDVNAPEVDGTTALHWAVRGDDVETAQLLIGAGAGAG